MKVFGAKKIDTTETISVDKCIQELDIGRRRIYDIINILESFGLLTRLRKNEYSIKSA